MIANEPIPKMPSRMNFCWIGTLALNKSGRPTIRRQISAEMLKQPSVMA